MRCADGLRVLLQRFPVAVPGARWCARGVVSCVIPKPLLEGNKKNDDAKDMRALDVHVKLCCAAVHPEPGG